MCLQHLGGVSQVLGQDVTDSLPFSHPLPQVGQLTSLSLDQRIVLPAQCGRQSAATGTKCTAVLREISLALMCIHQLILDKKVNVQHCHFIAANLPRPGGTFPFFCLAFALRSGSFQLSLQRRDSFHQFLELPAGLGPWTSPLGIR